MFDPHAVALDFRVMARDAHGGVGISILALRRLDHFNTPATRINLALTSVAVATIIDL
jgi:hypothetical protein